MSQLDPLAIINTNFVIIFGALLLTVILSFMLERICSVFFEYRYIAAILSLIKGLKTPISWGLAYTICWLWQFDVLSAIFARPPIPLHFGYHRHVGVFLTSLIITGGSKGAMKLFRDVLTAGGEMKGVLSGAGIPIGAGGGGGGGGGESGGVTVAAASSILASSISEISKQERKKKLRRRLLLFLFFLFAFGLFLRHHRFIPQDTGYVVVNQVLDFQDEMATKVYVIIVDQIGSIQFSQYIPQSVTSLVGQTDSSQPPPSESEVEAKSESTPASQPTPLTEPIQSSPSPSPSPSPNTPVVHDEHK